MNKTAGIDFGTTNTSIGYTDGQNVNMIPLQRNGSTTDTTSVFYSFEDGGMPIIGQEGKDESIHGTGGRMITSPKRFLKNDEMPEVQILRDKFSLIDIISHIVSDFKKKLEYNAGCEIESILVGRPVKFHDSDDVKDALAENRLKQAFQQAGFKNIEFQFEPIAAFNTYADQHKELTQESSKVLVVDLGGGTSDFSLVDIQNNKLEVLGNTGVYVGGDNLDEKMILSHYGKFLGKGAKQKIMNGSIIEIPGNIYNQFADKSKLLFFKEHEKLVKSLMPLLIHKDEKIGLSRLQEIFKDISIGYTFHALIEDIKKGLTTETEITSSFDMFKSTFGCPIHRTEFNSIIHRELEQIKKALMEVLVLAEINGNNVDKVIMNGGTSLVPIIQTIVNEIVGEGKILKGNTLSSVGYGLTLESYERFR